MTRTLHLELTADPQTAAWPANGLADYLDDIKQKTFNGFVDLDTQDNVRQIRIMYDDRYVDEAFVLSWLAEKGLTASIVSQE